MNMTLPTPQPQASTAPVLKKRHKKSEKSEESKPVEKPAEPMESKGTSDAPKKSKKTKAVAPVESAEPQPQPQAESQTAPVEQVKEEPTEQESGPEEQEQENSVRSKLLELIANSDEKLAQARQDSKDFRKLLKEFDAEVKNLTKKRKRVQDPNKKPSGLQKPVRLSSELLKFLNEFCNVSGSDPVSRSNVVKYLSSYIKEHNLKNPDLKREIQINRDPHNQLQKLFNPASYCDKKLPEKGPFYCDISIQRDIGHHFLKDNE
jgi:chromatin remodeling complex protein RSC6